MYTLINCEVQYEPTRKRYWTEQKVVAEPPPIQDLPVVAIINERVWKETYSYKVVVTRVGG